MTDAPIARELRGDDFALPAYTKGLSARVARAWRALFGENLEWKTRVAVRERNDWRDRALFFERRLTEERERLRAILERHGLDGLYR